MAKQYTDLSDDEKLQLWVAVEKGIASFRKVAADLGAIDIIGQRWGENQYNLKQLLALRRVVLQDMKG